MESITTKQIGNFIIKIFPDQTPNSPRNDDNLGTMICFHNRYSLGDKHDYKRGDYSSWEEMEGSIKRKEDAHIILPLYLYDHSGITISTSPFNCPWDSGKIGFIFVSKKKVREEYGVKRITPKITERVLKILEGEVQIYDIYLRGDVYGYEIYQLENGEETFFDSCWGYYGQDDCMDEAESIVKNLMKEEKEIVS